MEAQLFDVLQFVCESGGQPDSGTPHIPIEGHIRKLCKRIIEEEAGELVDALEEGDLEHISKEIVDVLYVVLYTVLYYGIPLQEVWSEVQRTNMEKRWPDGTFHHDPELDNKVIKPPGWEPPKLLPILRRYGMR